MAADLKQTLRFPTSKRTIKGGLLLCTLGLFVALSGCVIHTNQRAQDHGPHTATHTHHHCHDKVKKKRGKHKVKHKKRCHTHRHHDAHH